MKESLACQKLISIIVPTYNCCNYLEELILCIIKQTYKNWELIIIDDDSTDETSSMIKNIHLIKEYNIMCVLAI